MKLLVCGFNAHGQLNLDETETTTQDVWDFRQILQAEDLQVLYAGWADTLISVQGESESNTGTRLILAGHSAVTAECDLITFPHPLATDPATYFGSNKGISGAVSTDGQVYLFSPTSPYFIPQGDASFSPKVSHIAVTAADRVAVTIKTAPASQLNYVLEFSNLQSFRAWYNDPSADLPDPPIHHMIGGRCRQLEATATCFVFLTEHGEVYTWGDGRHYRCLGRTVTPESPASKPGKIDALGGIRIDKIASGGWLSAALSSDKALYIWGQARPGADGAEAIEAISSLSGSEEEVTLADVGSEADVSDVGIGDGHVVILTTDGRVFVAGDSDCGQLGLGIGHQHFAKHWKQLIDFTGRAVRVKCGDKSTFILVED